MKKGMVVAALFICLAIQNIASASTFVAKHGAMKAMGSKIVGADGNPVQAAGPSLYWSIWSGERFYNEAVVSKVASNWNTTLIRAAIAVEFTNGYLEKPAQQLTYAKTVIDAAIENGIYVLVDWHDHNANLHVKEAKEFFSELALTYKNTPNIIWEIWNEPDNVSGSGANGYDTWKDIKDYSEQIIPVIRQHSSNLIVVGTPSWSSDPSSAAEAPLSDPNVAYCLHFYSGTHKSAVRANADNALSKGVPLFITEFGIENVANAADTTLYFDEANTWLDWADSKGISWANWCLADIPGKCSSVIPGASFTGNWAESDLTPSGKWIRDRLLARPSDQDPNSDSVRVYVFTQGSGSISISPDIKKVKKGSSLTFTAVPAQGWEFKAWSDGATSTENPITLTINQNTSLVATFVPGSGTNMIKSGDFSDASKWSFWADDKDNSASVSFKNQQAEVTITKADTVNWKIQVSQGALTLDSGVTLVVSFDAWSTDERILFAGLSTATTYHFQGGKEVSLSAIKKTFTFEMTPDSTTAEGVLQFNCGKSTLPVYIDNVSLVKKDPSSVKKSVKYVNNSVAFRRSNDRIYWSASMKNSKVKLLDINGRVIMPETMSNPVILNNLNSGCYLFMIENSNQVFKFFK